MNLLDVILFIIMIAFVYKGAKQGIAYMIGQAIGIIIGVLVASRVFDDLAKILLPLFLGNYAISALFSFVLVFQVLNEMLGFLMRKLNIFSFLDHLPIISTFGTLETWIGGLLGLFVGNLILGVILYFLTRISLSPTIDELLQTSLLTPLLIHFSGWFIALFPPDFKALPSIIKEI